MIIFITILEYNPILCYFVKMYSKRRAETDSEVCSLPVDKCDHRELHSLALCLWCRCLRPTVCVLSHNAFFQNIQTFRDIAFISVFIEQMNEQYHTLTSSWSFKECNHTQSSFWTFFQLKAFILVTFSSSIKCILFWALILNTKVSSQMRGWGLSTL